MSLTRLLSALPEPLFSTYSIERVLGVGAYAVVYQIRDKYTSEAFALKVIEKEPLRIRLMLPQLAQEASLMEAHAGTPHIVELLETTMTRTHMFLRFNLCQESLEDLSNRHGPMCEEDAFRWIRQACEGIRALHASGVVHRDLKPSNFLVDREDVLHICDFGWACLEDEDMTGQCGTPDYSPPETKGQVHMRHTSKVDIYGLGASLQHLLLGRVPKGKKDLPAWISPATQELLGELMAPDPDSRPSIEELLSRPQLSENILEHIVNQWRLFFDIPAILTKKVPTIQDLSCGFGDGHEI